MQMLAVRLLGIVDLLTRTRAIFPRVLLPGAARTACAMLGTLVCVSLSPVAVRAQTPATAPAVEPVPSREALELSAALSQLSRDPRNVDALVNAGVAASKLGDFEAAVGFFKRGQALAPNNARLLAGLAGALVRQGDAASAIPLFARAQAAGAPALSLAADRGLAHDLIGDPASAQRYYAQALAAGIDVEEVTRRLGISQAISGDDSAMEKTLLPLLKKQDKAAWRARAFGLAIVGQEKEANRIVRTLLPGSLANSITPYLQYMPRLTRAQQAAAANLGVFPRASEIGRDEPRIAALAPVGSVRDAGKSLVPAGQPLGAGKRGASALSQRELRRQAKEAEDRARREAKLAEEQRKRETRLALASSRQPRVAPPDIQPARDDTPAQDGGFSVQREAAVPKVAEILAGRNAPAPAVAAVAAAPSPVPSSTPAPPVQPQPAPALAPALAAAAATPAVSMPPASVAAPGAPVASAPAASPQVAAAPGEPLAAPPVARPPVAASAFDLSRLPSSSAPAASPTQPPAQAAPVPVAATAPAPAPAPEPSFGDLFADLGKPTTAAAPVAGAVDLRKIKPKRPPPKPEVEVQKPKPSHPSRIWVQLGVGQKLAALGQDWRKMEKAYPALLKGRKPFTARLGQTNRLLTGPFASQKEASKFIDGLIKAGASRPMVWTSPAGEVVDDLGK